MAERLFSKARLTFSNLRRAMSMETLQMVLFLRLNRKLWDVGMLLDVWDGPAVDADDDSDNEEA